MPPPSPLLILPHKFHASQILNDFMTSVSLRAFQQDCLKAKSEASHPKASLRLSWPPTAIIRNFKPTASVFPDPARQFAFWRPAARPGAREAFHHNHAQVRLNGPERDSHPRQASTGTPPEASRARAQTMYKIYPAEFAAAIDV